MARGGVKRDGDDLEEKEPGETAEISDEALELLDEDEELADELGLKEESDDDKGWE